MIGKNLLSLTVIQASSKEIVEATSSMFGTFSVKNTHTYVYYHTPNKCVGKSESSLGKNKKQKNICNENGGADEFYNWNTS